MMIQQKMNAEQNPRNVRRSRTPLARPEHPAKPVRGIRATKARSGISLSNAYGLPARVGFAPSWRTG